MPLDTRDATTVGHGSMQKAIPKRGLGVSRAERAAHARIASPRIVVLTERSGLSDLGRRG